MKLTAALSNYNQVAPRKAKAFTSTARILYNLMHKDVSRYLACFCNKWCVDVSIEWIAEAVLNSAEKCAGHVG